MMLNVRYSLKTDEELTCKTSVIWNDTIATKFDYDKNAQSKAPNEQKMRNVRKLIVVNKELKQKDKDIGKQKFWISIEDNRKRKGLGVKRVE